MCRHASDLLKVKKPLGRAWCKILHLQEHSQRQAPGFLQSTERCLCRFEDDLARVDPSSEERDLLMSRHEEEVRRLTAQMAAEEARQVSSLDHKLAVRKAKKQKRLEASHVKELTQVKAHHELVAAGQHTEDEVVNIEEAKKRLEQEMREQEQAELDAMRQKMAVEKAQLMEEERMRLEQQLNSEAGADMSEEDRAKLISANEANMQVASYLACNIHCICKSCLACLCLSSRKELPVCLWMTEEKSSLQIRQIYRYIALTKPASSRHKRAPQSSTQLVADGVSSLHLMCRG